jgi:hypothetical protein
VEIVVDYLLDGPKKSKKYFRKAFWYVMTGFRKKSSSSTKMYLKNHPKGYNFCFKNR